MTTEPTQEPYPIDPEVEKTFSTGEIFAAVKPLEGTALHEDFSLVIGRRAGPNVAKGFSTGDGKTYCPGAEYSKQLPKQEVARFVVQSLLTNTRHSLYPDMPEVGNAKSEDYAERQKALATVMVELAGRLTSDEENDVMLDAVSDAYIEFMGYGGNLPDVALVSETFGNTLKLIQQLHGNLNADLS